MNVNEFFAGNLKPSLDMLKKHVGDMSDADLMMRPTPGANHANWQIGHLVVSENQLNTMSGAKMPELPAGFAERYSKETCKIDDPSKFATKADLIAQFERQRAATVAWASTLTQAQLDAAGPMPFLPTVAHLLNLGAAHIWMHCGQIQVLRRKLGKPILF